jgi:hypothetical protein
VAFIIGACCGCLLLTKQNVGVLYTLAVPVFIVLVCSNRTRFFAADNLTSLILIAVAFGVGALLPLAAVTALIGSDWIVSYASSDAKGSAATFLTRFMTDADTRRQLIAAMAIAAIWVVQASDVSLLTRPAFSSLKPYYERGEAFYRRAESLYRERVPAWAPPVRPILVRLALIVLVLLWARWRHVSAPLIVPLAGILIISVRSWRSEIDMGWWHRFSPALMGGLVYAGTMTAGLNQVSLEPLAAVTFAAICQFLSERVPFSGFRWSALAVAVMLVSVWMKASGPLYSWWGYLQGNIFSARFEVPFKQLSGFKVDAQTRDLFDTLSEYKSRLRGSDTIFAYPSIPIAYVLLDRPPPMRFPILWFDVTSERNAPEIIADLDKANPNYIFWLLPYRAVYEAHALLRRQTSLAFFIDRWIFAKIASGDYVLEKNEPLAAPVVLRPYDFGDRSVAEIFTAKDIKCGPYVWRTGGEQLCEEGSVLPAGKFATFVFRTRYDFIEAVRRDRIGIVTDHDYDRYQFLVLRRSDR